MELKEQEKFLKIKKEVVKMIENKKEKLKENNIKIDIISDIMNDEENYYILDFEGDKGVARLEITTPHFAPYYYACFNILWLNDDEAYWWLDEENSTVTEILKKLEKSLDYFVNYSRLTPYECSNAFNKFLKIEVEVKIWKLDMMFI